MTNFIELNRLCTTQLTVVFYNWLHQQHVSALLGHHQTYRLLYRWAPIDTATLCTLIDTNLCKPDDGQARPRHVADVTICRIQLSIVLCKDGLIQ